MKTDEAAEILVEAGKRAAEVLAPLKDLSGVCARVTLGVGLPVPLVRAIARVTHSEVRANGYYSEADRRQAVIESTGWSWEGVAIDCQGVRPLAKEDLPAVAPDTCSECSGPLDDEAGYSPGAATCRQCLDRTEEALERLEAKKVYAGNVRAEERASDAGVRGGA